MSELLKAVCPTVLTDQNTSGLIESDKFYNIFHYLDLYLQ